MHSILHSRWDEDGDNLDSIHCNYLKDKHAHNHKDEYNDKHWDEHRDNKDNHGHGFYDCHYRNPCCWLANNMYNAK